MRLSSVPPVAASLIAISDTILHIAPVSRAWRTDAPSNVVFLPPTLAKQALLLQIGLLRPQAIVVATRPLMQTSLINGVYLTRLENSI